MDVEKNSTTADRKGGEQMTNTVELKNAMERSGLKYRFIAEKCGLSYQGFLNKVHNITAFTAPEIVALRNLLELSPDESEKIFFAGNVE